MEHCIPDNCNLLPLFYIFPSDEGLGSLYAVENATHKPQVDAPARDTIGCLDFRSRTLGLAIWNDMDARQHAANFETPTTLLEMTEFNDLNSYSTVCGNWVSTNRPHCPTGRSSIALPSNI
jgi:hypothetical protein